MMSGMASADWNLTEDLDVFLDRAGAFLRSRPALHNTSLTTIARLRASQEPALLGWLDEGGETLAAFYRLTSHRLNVTVLSPGQCDDLARRLSELDLPLAGVTAEYDTAIAFAQAWQRRTEATPSLRNRLHLYELGALTPQEPAPEGRGHLVSTRDRDLVVRWCREFCVDVGEKTSVEAIDAGAWADTRFADKNFTFWKTPDGTPVSMAGWTPMIAGMVRVDPVHTPKELRGHGYANAVTAEVSRTALAAGATDVVLYTDPANTTSNALYQRLGYVRLTDWAAFDL